MEVIKTVVLLSAATFWVLLIGGWNSTVVQRMLAAFLAARAESLDSKRAAMIAAHESWKIRLGVKETNGTT